MEDLKIGDKILGFEFGMSNHYYYGDLFYNEPRMSKFIGKIGTVMSFSGLSSNHVYVKFEDDFTNHHWAYPANLAKLYKYYPILLTDE